MSLILKKFEKEGREAALGKEVHEEVDLPDDQADLGISRALAGPVSTGEKAGKGGAGKLMDLRTKWNLCTIKVSITVT